MDNFGFKDFEDVSLKSTYSIELGSRTIEPGEVIAFFNRIQIAGLDEVSKYVSANGGFDNRAHVWWETSNELRLNFTQGVFSKDQFALGINTKLIEKPSGEPTFVSMRESIESNETGRIVCKHIPARNTYIYSIETGEKLSFIQDGSTLIIQTPFTSVIVDYEFEYVGKTQTFCIGQKLTNGYLSLEGKTRLKDDTTGQVVTGVIKIPKLKLMSDLSIRLGANANPYLVNFKAVGVPVGSRGASRLSEFYILDDDITSDL